MKLLTNTVALAVALFSPSRKTCPLISPTQSGRCLMSLSGSDSVLVSPVVLYIWIVPVEADCCLSTVYVQYDRLIDSGHSSHSVPLPFIFYLLCNRQPGLLSDVSIFFSCVMCFLSFGLSVGGTNIWFMFMSTTQANNYFEAIGYLVCWFFVLLILNRSLITFCFNMHIESFHRDLKAGG